MGGGCGRVLICDVFKTENLKLFSDMCCYDLPDA